MGVMNELRGVDYAADAARISNVVITGPRGSGKCTLIDALFGARRNDAEVRPDTTIIVVDARHGVQSQHLHDLHVAHLHGVALTIVAVNKMDLVGNDYVVFRDIVRDFGRWAQQLGFGALRYVPISALPGDNVSHRAPDIDWYEGPTLAALCHDR